MAEEKQSEQGSRITAAGSMSAGPEIVTSRELLPRPQFTTTEKDRLGVRDIMVDPEDWVWFLVSGHGLPEVGTTLSVFIGDKEVPIEIAVDPAQNAVSHQGIPAKAFEGIPDGDVTIHYTWNYPDGSRASSADAAVRIKRTVPGDPQQPIGEHTNEDLYPLQFSPDPVVPGTEAVTFSVGPWDNASVGDVVELMLNGHSFKHVPLSAEQIGSRLSFPLPIAEVLSSGYGLLRAEWSVRDDCGNWSGYAPSTEVLVTIQDPNIPDAPVLIKPDDDAPFEQGSEIDLAALAADKMKVSVAGPAAPFYKNLTSIALHLRGIDLDGKERKRDWEASVVNNFIPRFFIETQELVRLGNGGRVFLSCTLRTRTDGDVESNIAFWKVTGNRESAIDDDFAPTIDEADPYTRTLTLLDKATVITVRTGREWKKGDIVELIINGNMELALSQNVGADGVQPFSVPPSFYIPEKGETITLEYTVTRPGEKLKSSGVSYTLEEKQSMPLGNCVYNSGNGSTITVSPSGTVPVYKFLLVGQKIWRNEKLDAFPLTSVTCWNQPQYILRNLRGVQPQPTGATFPTEIPGLGMRFYWHNISPLLGGPRPFYEGRSGTGAANRGFWMFGFEKTGPLPSSFTLKAGDLACLEIGQEKAVFVKFVLDKDVTFVESD